MRSRAGRWAVVGALAVCALLWTGGAGGTEVLRLDGGISAIAANGKRVAVTVRSTRATCDGILLWAPSSGRTVRVSAGTNCPGDTSLRERIREVALAGDRVAWIEETNGNLQELTLRVHRLDRRTTIDLAFADNHNGAEGIADGRYVGYLRGDGDILAYNTWTVCTLVPADYEWDGPSCEARAGDEPAAIIGSERLWTLGATRAVFGAGPSAFALAALDHGRVATSRRRQITVFNPQGLAIGSIRLDSGRISGVGLWGALVTALRAGRLEVHSIATGELVKTLAAPAGSGLTDVDGALAALVGRSSVTVTRLTDGASTTFRVRGGRAVGADIEPSGLFHAWSLSPGGRIVFVSRAELDAALDQAAARAQSP